MIKGNKTLEKLLNYVQLFISMVVTYFITLIGGYDDFIGILFLFNVIDFFTGMIKGALTTGLTSNAFYMGGYKKFLIYLVIILTNKVDQTFNGIYLRQTTIIYFIINEWISIFENISYYIDLPPQIAKFFEKLKDDTEKTEYNYNLLDVIERTEKNDNVKK